MPSASLARSVFSRHIIIIKLSFQPYPTDMSWLRALLQKTFGLVRHHVGSDQFGNKYYYIPQQRTWTGQTIRERRTVEAVHKKAYEYEEWQIPLEWEAWIRGKRKDPPTIEEILKNETYREVIKLRSKEASEKDQLQQATEYEEGIAAKPGHTQIKGHASAPFYGKTEPSEDPTSTANSFQPGSWTPPSSSKRNP
ncbi:NADH dehydrogenase [ubiquinone] 1 alpha subcomplex assembly factor 2 isoform X1 [Rhinatrema bivittatum]|uniref:NADH dehydrogenase [ubiquinone] 1 alpha subcomplex assembly factor 2 isoform X1 n=1 Tax=Rhinatrema bivittatum TaxID=194408 RepID=UPI00112D3858|nr:NADH dehydrogenase [ubiquinone] 1 alpha subcomplex assembly factor 2 isoform X1 [Rhinatrema bivittatum]